MNSPRSTSTPPVNANIVPAQRNSTSTRLSIIKPTSANEAPPIRAAMRSGGFSRIEHEPVAESDPDKQTAEHDKYQLVGHPQKTCRSWHRSAVELDSFDLE